jgi:hypothetical protein
MGQPDPNWLRPFGKFSGLTSRMFGARSNQRFDVKKRTH